MKVDFKVKIGARLKKTVEAQVTRVEKAAVRSINDSLFDMRKLTPTLLAYAIDQPVPFTMRGITVDKATPDKMIGRLSLGSVQSSYLAHGEEGDPDDELIIPIAKEGRNRHGNLRTKFRRPKLEETIKQKKAIKNKVYKGKKTRGKGVRVKRRKRLEASHEVSQYFLGRANGGPAGIYERYQSNRKLRLIARFQKRRQNKEIFNIRETWNSELNIRFKENFRKRMSGIRR